MDSEIALFWLKIVQQHPELEGRIYHAEHFGTPGDLALQLSELIVSGEKYATCGALDEYWHEDDHSYRRLSDNCARWA